MVELTLSMEGSKRSACLAVQKNLLEFNVNKINLRAYFSAKKFFNSTVHYFDHGPVASHDQ